MGNHVSTGAVHHVVLTVTDDSGSACDSGQTTATAFINAPPLAKISSPAEILFVGGAHDEFVFDASGSTDPDGEPLTYHWDFGDNTKGRGPKAAHTFDKPGRYQVTLAVRDSSGTGCASATDQVEVQVTKREALH